MEEAWARALMELSPAFRKSPGEVQDQLIQEALSAGRDFALCFLQRFGENFTWACLTKAAEQLGCVILQEQKKSLVPFLSDFDPNNRRITLYQRNIDAFYAKIEGQQRDCFQRYTLPEMCLLHELCHVLEYERYGRVGSLLRVQTKGWFFHRNVSLRQASELAAHEFVKTLMKLPVSPGTFGRE